MGVLKRGILQVETLAVCAGFTYRTSPARYLVVNRLQNRTRTPEGKWKQESHVNELQEKKKNEIGRFKNLVLNVLNSGEICNNRAAIE
jgi:hypothetical protein